MNRLLRSIFPPNAEVASLPLVFLSMAFVAVLQMPAQALVRAGWVSAGVAVNEIFAVAGVPLALIWALDLRLKRLVNFSPLRAPRVLFVVLATMGAVVMIDYATHASEIFMPIPDSVGDAYAKLMETKGAWQIAAKLVSLCALPAICEEIYFRGFCLTSIEARLGRWPAIIVSALIFSAMHGNIWYAHLYFLLGVLLGWVYCSTGSLFAAVLCHFINNAWTFLNYVRGFKLPVSERFNSTDAAFMALACAVLAISLYELRRRSFPSCASRKRPPLR